MEAAPSPMGVAAAPKPPERRPATNWATSTAEVSVRLTNPAPSWSRPAQGIAALFLLLAVGLLAWHTYAAQRGSCRPTTVEAGDTVSATFDLNEADHAQLLQLPGVGENLAQRIEVYRAEHNGFRDVDELRQVRGIGPKQLEKIRPFLRVAPQADHERVKPDQDAPPHSSGKKPLLTQPINVNRASGEELRRLPGIGPKLSQRILDTRARKPFQSVEDLRRVPGIGPKTLERLRPFVTIGEKAS